jgi:hypothetical protein
MSGRGLGFTGGTIDKLEAIPGFRTALSGGEFLANLGAIGVAITGQTPTSPRRRQTLRPPRRPAPLKASPHRLFDHEQKNRRWRRQNPPRRQNRQRRLHEDARRRRKTGRSHVAIGARVGRETMAVISSMHEPLGLAVGNSLEVAEAIDILAGTGGAPELREYASPSAPTCSSWLAGPPTLPPATPNSTPCSPARPPSPNSPPSSPPRAETPI